MTGQPSDIESFLAALVAIERAWILLDAADPSPADIAEAVRLGGASAQVLTRAAALRTATDPSRAHALLEQAVALEAPPAPAQLALSRSFRARGDKAEASRWLRGAMLRARPDAALLLELATIETDHAREIVEAAQVFPCRDVATAMAAGRTLLACGKKTEARIACTMAFEAGARDGDFLIFYSDLLADVSLHDDPPLPPGPLGMPHWWNVATGAAQVRLAQAHPAPPVISRAEQREASDRWVGDDRLGAYLKDRIETGAPFSWIRLGDGEARFLMHLHPDLRAALAPREADAMARQIWFAWFGQEIDAVPPESLDALGARLDRAIRNADLLGVTSAERLRTDATHYGFCAGLETYLGSLLADRTTAMFADALAPVALNRRDPFLGSLLRGRDFLGVISPHPDLAGRLRQYLDIGTVASYDLPGETRLARPSEARNRGAHFPAVYEQVLATLSVPHPGAVFLVAGGLLGKIYCDRIRELGGIALDIGALADAWVGQNARGRLLDDAPMLPPAG